MSRIECSKINLYPKEGKKWIHGCECKILKTQTVIEICYNVVVSVLYDVFDILYR